MTHTGGWGVLTWICFGTGVLPEFWNPRHHVLAKLKIVIYSYINKSEKIGVTNKINQKKQLFPVTLVLFDSFITSWAVVTEIASYWYIWHACQYIGLFIYFCHWKTDPIGPHIRISLYIASYSPLPQWNDTVLLRYTCKNHLLSKWYKLHEHRDTVADQGSGRGVWIRHREKSTFQHVKR